MSIIDRLRAAGASARHWLKHTSVQLAVLAGAVGAYAAAYPDQAQQALALVPEQYRPLATFLVVTALPIWARVRSQGLAPKGDGQNQ